MRFGHTEQSLDKGTPVARRIRKATGLHRSSPGYRLSVTPPLHPTVMARNVAAAAHL